MDENELSEETHDIYAWTEVWNGVDKPLFNCTRDLEDHGDRQGRGFEDRIESCIDPLEISSKIDPMRRTWNIYFFGPKSEL
jgi:hypothetical protein